jgi:NADPH:quinone reductase
MRAIAVRHSGGTPELMELPVPRPAPGEVLVKLVAAAINPMDLGMANGLFEGRMPHVYPMVLGVDGAGVVEAAGEGVGGLRPGDLVHGQFLRAPVGNGTFADYAAVPEFPDSGALQRVPDGVPVEAAAALPTAGMTATGINDAVAPCPGQTVLIVGATGGVGALAVQLAAARGARVIATARPGADEWIRRLGAADTVDYTVDSTSGPVADQVSKSHPDGVDAVLDLTRDPEGFAERAELVRDGGTALSITFAATPELLATERITVTNYTMTDKPGLLARITAEVAAGRVTVPVQRIISLEEVPGALAVGGARGKTVVRI